MEEAIAARYWCHRCSQMVNPIMEVAIKCPFCQDGFVEELGSGTRDSPDTDSDIGSERAFSLWGPILLGMIGNSRRRRFRRIEFDDDDDENENDDGEARHGRDTQLDREFESILRRRRRSYATILQVVQGIQTGIASESENSENDRDRHRDRERERVILINPLNQTILVQGSFGSSEGGQNQDTSPIGSLSDYFIGPNLDLLLQHLAENDPNRYGTPPAQKEAIEALPTVNIEENIQCSVCLDDFEIGTEAKEMPCKHKFHCGCILPWLELHSSCPVCRCQLPADESKLESERSRNSTNQRESENNAHVSGEESEGDGRSRSGRRFSFLWPFNGFFSSSGSNSTSTSSGSPSGSPSQANEN
ncbi:hypothetical protein SLE2022_008350 [Rubroshorea leprosula]